MKRNLVILFVGLLIFVDAAYSNDQPRKIVRIHLKGQVEETIKNFLSSGPDILFYGKEGEFVEVLARGEELQKFQALDLTTEILLEDADAYARTLRQQGYLEPFHTYNEMLQEMQQAVAVYSDIAQLHDIGDSYEKTVGRGGYDIWALKISDNVSLEEEDEAEVLFMANIHAREIITPEIILYFMHYLTDNYGTEPYVTHLINHRQIWLIPMINPDGHEYVFSGTNFHNWDDPMWWRKNKHDNDGNNNFDPYYDGVDLNRNFGFMWGYDNAGSSPDPWDQTFRGAFAFSEPESQAIRNLVQAHRFVISISYHSYGGYWLVPWGYIRAYTPDHKVFMALADSAITYNDYVSGTSWECLYLVNGDTDDWLYGDPSKNKIFAFTPEVRSGGYYFFPDTSNIVPLILENLGPNLFMAYAAGEEPIINHTLLPDTEDPVGPYPVVATITPPIVLTQPVALEPSTFKLFYNTTGTAPFDSTLLLPTGNPDEYTAQIPGQGNQVTIYYYFSASDSSGRTGHAPRAAPGRLFSFRVKKDMEPPVFTQTTQLPNTSDTVGPYTVTSIITDDTSIALVFLFFRTDADSTFTMVPMPSIGDHTFQGEIPGQPYGTTIEYYLQAIDDFSNISTDPPDAPTTTYSFFVTDQVARIAVTPVELGFTIKQGEAVEDTLTISNLGLLDLTFNLRDSLVEGTEIGQGTEAGVPWLNELPIAGIVPGGSSFDVRILVNGEVLPVCAYQAVVIITSNDTLNSELLVPVQVTVEPVSAVEEVAVSGLPQAFWLSQNYPNPFSAGGGLARSTNPQTTIVYHLPRAGKVSLKIYNTLGQLIKTLTEAKMEAGCYTAFWDGTDDLGQTVTSGIYLYQLRTEGLAQTRKMLWLR
ncbi:MAG: M14 family zinc carboxypeptidase [candidate division KSB1 bacterium]|nr:M14 family zinc carboxypeptidase [candidate division KSB1 bacterium]